MDNDVLVEGLRAAGVLLFYHHDAAIMVTIKNGLPCPVCSGKSWKDAPELRLRVMKALREIEEIN
jgi:hypothetical protein